MANFIIIGTDNRFSNLVDSIEKCLPLNSDVCTHLSTGKIEKRDKGVIYTYLINGERQQNNEPRRLSDLLLNQIAAFRHAYNAQGLLNIFTLENPMSNEELKELKDWMQEIEKVFEQDKDIHIHRVCVDYNLSFPNDVTRKMPFEVIKDYFESKDHFTFKDSSDILYLNNRDNNGAVIVSGQKDHDFILPRLLADFMMLLSSTDHSYGAFTAINQSKERCFSLGYAESMYYFPDVKEYYKHADKRSFYEHILNDPDETVGLNDDEEAMDIEKHPLGLNRRKEWLTNKYADVPFDKDIKLYEDSADFVIDNCLQKLKILLYKKYQEEIEKRKDKIDVDDAIMESNEDFDSLTQDDWEPKNEVPLFINREEIFDNSDGYDDKKQKEDYLKNAKEQYDKLVTYTKGNDFFNYVKDYDNNRPVVVPNNLKDNPGCLLKFWRKKPQEEAQFTPSPTPSSMLDNIKEIRKQLNLKKKFEDFLSKRGKIEEEMKSEEKWCNEFRLTDHSHHYYHLINLPELKNYQKREFEKRFTTILQQWNANEKDKNLNQLKELLRKDTEDYTNKLKFIDWDNPFPFVSDLSDSKLAEVCNELYCKSSPFVHYDIIAEQALNDINLTLYSDIPDFPKKFGIIQNNIIVNGLNISAYTATHIASKFCFFQILPLDIKIITTPPLNP